MQTTGTVVEAGRGVLGGPGYPEYEIRVADTVTTLWSRDRSATETTPAYEIIWWPAMGDDLPIGDRPITKIFESAAEREEFLATRVRTQVSLTPADETFERHHPLAEIVGEALIGVWFGPMSVQLDFQPTGTTPVPAHRGPMTFDLPPNVLHARGTLASGDSGYADGLVGLIGTAVAEVDDYLDLGIYIGFENGTALSAPLYGVDAVEVAHFQTASGLYVWTSREAPQPT